MKPQLDRLSARHWIFPLNRPKRTYQFSIVQAALLKNTLVALPTGLGKTFIAGVVMLNYWRWFPTGKIIFLCPTKPLVAQQIVACHNTCGIPGSDATEMHGEILKVKRAHLWEQKRVFYMTPQTLKNDLTAEIMDLRDIVLMVIVPDEAHKATGAHAYTTTVRDITEKNPACRILALTATPSSDKDKIQPIIDALRIGHIEIRNETSLDISPYIKRKEKREIVIRFPPHLASLRDSLANIMLSMLKLLRNGEIPGSLDPLHVRPFTIQSALGNMKNQPGSAAWTCRILNDLHSLATAMNRLEGFGAYKHQRTLPAYTKTPDYKKLLQDFTNEKKRGTLVHPKMQKLRELLLDYFGAPVAGSSSATQKAIVFVSLRSCVDEIVEYLTGEEPTIRPARFVGQGTDNKGGKGILISQQLIQQFQSSNVNVLISTSIGEEGLDIGEVDLIICYETPSSPIRGLQRAGRTGRQRDGQLILLMTENREEGNWTKAQEKYEQVQSAIQSAHYKLHQDPLQLLPPDMTCIERIVECEPYVREVTNRRKRRCEYRDDGYDLETRRPKTGRSSSDADRKVSRSAR
ncbi:P-loop containing nucleoside triphosphate hydrolase protein [Auricularia subglabra TFB-10046 SS5]|uniref:ATP-dependent DNA helicase n=1 Tax=Auricularia subglabra (strain TFB-10046 / SS5) TaxID=717982 RepID=J0D5B7_AURST|nr:P-loop containing nucleoside triphosphate hydrolase protein [Auricularia subglabra TFB-10046 SS5]